MTGEEQELLEQYLTHLNVLGEEGTHPDFEAGTRRSATPRAPTLPAPRRRPQSCASRTSSTPPGCSTPTGCQLRLTNFVKF